MEWLFFCQFSQIYFKMLFFGLISLIGFIYAIYKFNINFTSHIHMLKRNNENKTRITGNLLCFNLFTPALSYIPTLIWLCFHGCVSAYSHAITLTETCRQADTGILIS